MQECYFESSSHNNDKVYMFTWITSYLECEFWILLRVLDWLVNVGGSCFVQDLSGSKGS